MAKVDAIDLTEVKKWLMLPKEGDKGEGWDEVVCAKTERRYKMYLKLCYLHPEVPLVPTLLIDEMWHHHVLLTRKYAMDCMQTVGYFIHHTPLFDIDQKKHEEEYAITRQLFLDEFNECLGKECPASCCIQWYGCK